MNLIQRASFCAKEHPHSVLYPAANAFANDNPDPSQSTPPYQQGGDSGRGSNFPGSDQQSASGLAPDNN